MKVKLCECGCGLPAPISKRTEKKRGYVKGEPLKFVAGHNIAKPTKNVMVKCEYCGKELEKYPSDAKRFRFCSRKCQGLDLRYSHNICEIGTKYTDYYGYVHIKTEDGWIREHRLVMESKLGRKLTSKDIVHHINEDKKDNSPENLELTNASDHAKIHLNDDFIEKGKLSHKKLQRDEKGRFLKEVKG